MQVNIETAQVSIKVVQVNNKQMTKAVFRQLPERGVYNSEGNLVPMEHWGIIRENVGDGKLWVLAVDGGVLVKGDINLGQFDHAIAAWEVRKAEAQLRQYDQWEADWAAHDASVVERDAALARIDERWPTKTSANFDERKMAREALPQLVSPPSTPPYWWPRGQRAEVEDIFNYSKVALTITSARAVARETLLKLPQLFIAI